MSDLVGNPEDRFSHTEAHIRYVSFVTKSPAIRVSDRSGFKWVYSFLEPIFPNIKFVLILEF